MQGLLAEELEIEEIVKLDEIENEKPVYADPSMSFQSNTSSRI